MKRSTAYATFTTLSLLADFWVSAVLVLFVRSLNFAPWIYVWGLSSVVATLCLLVAISKVRSQSKIPVVIGAAGSVVFFLASIPMLIEITPIAQGNYDSGEVFWFLMLPMILSFAQASVAYLKFKNRTSEVTPWPQ
jgi:hypothetical protein